MKNRVAGLLMKTGVSYNKAKPHRKGYFHDLMWLHPRGRRQYPASFELLPGTDRSLPQVFNDLIEAFLRAARINEGGVWRLRPNLICFRYGMETPLP